MSKPKVILLWKCPCGHSTKVNPIHPLVGNGTWKPGMKPVVCYCPGCHKNTKQGIEAAIQ